MCLRLPSTEEQRAAEPGNKSGQRIAEDTLTSDAAYLARSTGASTEQALAFAREHVGLTMIDALSLFKRQLVDQAHRRAQQAADSLPQNIAERRQRELEDMLQRQNEFRQKAMQDMEKASADLMAPIQKKLNEAIQAVGKAEGVVYIFDMARAAISYVDETKSINLTAKVKTQLGIK